MVITGDWARCNKRPGLRCGFYSDQQNRSIAASVNLRGPFLCLRSGILSLNSSP